MSMIDKALKGNEEYTRRYDPSVGGHPHPKIAVVTCMDPRLSDLEGILGLKNADLDVIRTGGPAVTDDVLGGCRFHAGARLAGDYASQPHRLRVHDLHGRGVERQALSIDGRCDAGPYAILLI